jgi:hypothetical protein
MLNIPGARAIGDALIRGTRNAKRATKSLVNIVAGSDTKRMHDEGKSKSWEVLYTNMPRSQAPDAVS